jgi:glycosyltransferase involved in cell wall biosynthesis
MTIKTEETKSFLLQKNPIFSIITVCLNAGIELHKTIESVLAQDFSYFNIVIKDSFSIDQSFITIPTDGRIIKIQKKDMGIYDAMNQALGYANGEYVLFFNAGDYFHSNDVLSLYYNAIINDGYLDLIYCDYTTTSLGEYVQSPPRLSRFFLFRTMLCHQVCMIKREYYEKIGRFDTKFKVDADYDFLLRLLIGTEGTYKHIKMLCIVSTSDGFSSFFHFNALIYLVSFILTLFINLRKKDAVILSIIIMFLGLFSTDIIKLMYNTVVKYTKYSIYINEAITNIAKKKYRSGYPVKICHCFLFFSYIAGCKK